MANRGYVTDTRIALRPGCTGVIALTTTPQKVLAPPVTGDTRWVLGGSRVHNYGAVECEFVLHYVPIGGSPTTGNRFGGHPVTAKDYIQLGEFPMVPGYEVWASATANSLLNIIIFFEEVE